MSRRMWVLAVTAWVAVVAAGSALTWVAISRAGDQVTTEPGVETTLPAVIGTVGVPPSVSATPTQAPSATASSSTPSVPTTSAPTHPPTTRATSRPRTSSPPPQVQTVTRTWSGQPGTLTVSCTGSTVRFKSASPADGWSFERGESSGGEVEVTFKSNETEVQVKATCVGGTPQFHVESGSSSDGSDD